jgi:hypothetical protein
MKKEYKYFNADWDIVKIDAKNKTEANNLFKQRYPDKDIKTYNLIEPSNDKTKYTTLTFSEYEKKLLGQ